ncbi:uncharacterized protein LOC144108538 [Amblyomma americanum]
MAPPGRSKSPTTPTTPPFVIMAPPRDPGKFSGTDGSDVENWINLYERVSNYNRWDPTLMLANVIFYLNGTARVWYETHEEELTSWDTFKEKLKTLFGRPDDRQLAAKKQLATRAQSSTESYVAYIQDILALCHKVDAAMSETDKVGHVLKGIADDAFHLLVCKDCTSIDSIINECRRFEQVKGRRISPSFSRLPNTAATSSCEDHRSPSRTPSDAPAVTDSVTRIVRRELEALAPVISPPSVPDTTLPAVSLIQAVVRQELAHLNLAPAVCAIRSPDTPQPPPCAFRRTYYSLPRSRNPNDWRTSDDQGLPNAVKGILYNAVYYQTQEDIFSDLVALNPRRHFTIADARQLGHTKTISVTFIGTTEVPRQLVFYGTLYTCHPFKAKV